MKISVGIATYNRLHSAIDVVNLLLEQSVIPNEIIIIDQSNVYQNSSNLKILDLCKTGNIKYIFQKTPNLPKARNTIIKLSQCEIILFIDDDVVFNRFFVENHLINYHDNNIHAVAGRVIEKNDNISSYKIRSWNKYLDYKYFDFGWDYKVINFGTVKGCNHSIRRDVITFINGYDESYYGTSLREETDMAFKLLINNYNIVFDPKSLLLHLKEPSGGCRLDDRGVLSASDSIIRFSFKYSFLLKSFTLSELWYAFRLAVLNKKNLEDPKYLFINMFIFFKQIIKNLKNLKIND